MRAEQRVDPEHFDGAASMIHAGLTLWGKRILEYQTVDGDWRSISQEPDSIYVANMCAARHRVRHLPEDQPEPLFRGYDLDAKVSFPGLQATVRFRTDVFRHMRARCGLNKPCPEDVFDAVNSIVARKLAREPWTMPSLAECIAHS